MSSSPTLACSLYKRVCPLKRKEDASDVDVQLHVMRGFDQAGNMIRLQPEVANLMLDVLGWIFVQLRSNSRCESSKIQATSRPAMLPVGLN